MLYFCNSNIFVSIESIVYKIIDIRLCIFQVVWLLWGAGRRWIGRSPWRFHRWRIREFWYGRWTLRWERREKTRILRLAEEIARPRLSHLRCHSRMLQFNILVWALDWNSLTNIAWILQQSDFKFILICHCLLTNWIDKKSVEMYVPCLESAY